MKNIVVLTGAGISAESGLKTFRDSDGLWENHKVTDVATPEAWLRNPEMVLRFYNERREQVREAVPNNAHLALVELEEKFNVNIITQNIDDLHERAGSSQVMHLHGKINQACSSKDVGLVYDSAGKAIEIGDLCELNSQLRPNIVWFGEAVPMIEKAIPLMAKADIVMVIGTSLQVYPAASLLDFTLTDTKIYNIDPNSVINQDKENIIIIKQKAGEAVPGLVKEIMSNFN